MDAHGAGFVPQRADGSATDLELDHGDGPWLRHGMRSGGGRDSGADSFVGDAVVESEKCRRDVPQGLGGGAVRLPRGQPQALGLSPALPITGLPCPSLAGERPEIPAHALSCLACLTPSVPPASSAFSRTNSAPRPAPKRETNLFFIHPHPSMSLLFTQLALLPR